MVAKVPESQRDRFSQDLGRLKLVEVVCFEQLYGYLSENGKTLEHTRHEKTTHIDNTVASARLYLQHCDAYPGNAGKFPHPTITSCLVVGDHGNV